MTRDLGVRDDMVRITGGPFTMGSDEFYPDERPVHERVVADFEIDRYAVTNRDFATFVEETAYVTIAERPIDAAQFGPGGEGGKKQRLLQDIFLSRVRDAAVQVTMFLVNGVMLQGRIAAYDLFCMLLEREGFVQLAYKHAVSTIQPAAPVDLTTEFDEEVSED